MASLFGIPLLTASLVIPRLAPVPCRKVRKPSRSRTLCGISQRRQGAVGSPCSTKLYIFENPAVHCRLGCQSLPSCRGNKLAFQVKDWLALLHRITLTTCRRIKGISQFSLEG
ncbi:hypothetical protein F5Y03DRAFT_207082 [Xylaria venustula]|nr:hypothetical protein F5Y03DRAFT_207082 [Xylaria venustula]